MKVILVLFCVCVAISAPISAGVSEQKHSIMLAGFSRKDGMFQGGIGADKRTRSGVLATEVIAWITPDGRWTKLPCNNRDEDQCRRFEHDYLSHRHTYKIVSSDGQGATISTAPVSLSECFGFDGPGMYSGAFIDGSGIAASAEESFAPTTMPAPLDPDTAARVRGSLSAIAPSVFDSLDHLRLFSLQLNEQKLIVVQRAFEDYEGAAESNRLALIFLIGQLHQGHFRVLHSKANTQDEEERILGVFKLKSGPEFLITVVRDPESQSFRAYAVEHGELKIVFSGGGASC